MSEELDVSRDLSWLQESERFALSYFESKQGVGSSQYSPISPLAAEAMYPLFLQGRTFDEIRKLNPHFSLGQIVSAAVNANWFDRRQAHSHAAVSRARARAILAAADGVELASDIIAALRAQHGDAIAKYLQTGDVNVLNQATSIDTIRKIKEAGEVLMKLTGQDQIKRVSVSGTVDFKQQEENSSSKIRDWARSKKEAER
jgi:septum formation topological specificity factor MinE